MDPIEGTLGDQPRTPPRAWDPEPWTVIENARLVSLGEATRPTRIELNGKAVDIGVEVVSSRGDPAPGHLVQIVRRPDGLSIVKVAD